MYRRKPIEDVGGFDTRIRKPGGEDPGLSFALRANGLSLVYESSAMTFYRYGVGCAVATADHHTEELGPNELHPTPMTFRGVGTELRYAWHRYKRDGLALEDLLRFSDLALVQRIAYNAGWRRGRG